VQQTEVSRPTQNPIWNATLTFAHVKADSLMDRYIDIQLWDLERLKDFIPHSDRKQKLQLEKLSQEFENVVQKYSIQQKRISQATRQSYQVALEADREAEISGRAELRQQELDNLDELKRFNDTLEERRRQVELIEKDVIDINIIMNQLSTLVADQRIVVGTYS